MKLHFAEVTSFHEDHIYEYEYYVWPDINWTSAVPEDLSSATFRMRIGIIWDDQRRRARVRYRRVAPGINWASYPNVIILREFRTFGALIGQFNSIARYVIKREVEYTSPEFAPSQYDMEDAMAGTESAYYDPMQPTGTMRSEALAAKRCQECTDARCGYWNTEHPRCIIDNEGIPGRIYNDWEGAIYCGDHFADLVGPCPHCGRQVRTDSLTHISETPYAMFEDDWTAEEFCTMCVEGAEEVIAENYTCNACGEIDQGLISRRDGDRWCSPCNMDQPEWFVQSYSFKPPTIFHPEIPDDPRTLYHGFEFEVAGMSEDSACEWAEAVDLPADLFYLKSDSSVDHGTEVVTHPFTMAWALQNFPFEKMDQAASYGAIEEHHSAGTHIHVNKSSFTRAHMWKFIQMHFQMQPLLTKLGGRASTGYAAWEMTTIRDRATLKDLAIKKQLKQGVYAERSSAINVLPTHTIELRYPASGFSSRLARKNMELANGLWQFSNEISVKHVSEGLLTNSGTFQWWIQQEKAQFPTLHQYMVEVIPTPTPFERSN